MNNVTEENVHEVTDVRGVLVSKGDRIAHAQVWGSTIGWGTGEVLGFSTYGENNTLVVRWDEVSSWQKEVTKQVHKNFVVL